MKFYEAQNQFYSKEIIGPTSSEEFANRRVHVTNEIPPQDLYSLSHSLVKNDLWKWFFGSRYVIESVPYNAETNGIETVDEDGNFENLTIAKYVNGIRAMDFGPKPTLKYNPHYKKDFLEYESAVKRGVEIDLDLTEEDFKYKTTYPEGYHIELNGTLIAEMDLLLHEGYRYLDALYPDHPDFMNIFTLNEFDDNIINAAAIIGYNPDTSFLNWFPANLDYGDLSEDDKQLAKLNESSKMKIRNLKNNAFREKFYGSKSGYKQFGSEIFQHVSVYPVCYYIPCENISLDDYQETYYGEYIDDDPKTEEIEVISRPRDVDFKWFRKFEKQPSDFVNSNVNLSHQLYKKLFRTIDWDNSSYDFINRWKEPAKFYGTAYPTPYGQFDLYEYPNERVLDYNDVFNENEDITYTFLTMEDDFKPGQKIKIGGQDNYWTDYKTGHISYIKRESSYDVVAHIEENLYAEVHEKPNSVVHVAIDTPAEPCYTYCTIYRPNDVLLSKIIEHDNLPEVIEDNERINTRDFMQDYVNAESLVDSTRKLHEIYYSEEVLAKFRKRKIDIEDVKTNVGFTPDPHQDGCLYMMPEQFLTTFEEELNIKLDITPELGGTGKSIIEYGFTDMSNNGFIKKNDFIEYKDENRYFLQKALDITGAYVQFSLDGIKNSYEYITEQINKVNNAETARYGIAMQLSKTNPEAGNEFVVLYGSPTMADAAEFNAKGDYYSPFVYFDIKAIPITKSHAVLRMLYDSFSSKARSKWESLNTLLNGKYKGASVGGNLYKKTYDIIDELNKSYGKLIDDETKSASTFNRVSSSFIRAIKNFCSTLTADQERLATTEAEKLFAEVINETNRFDSTEFNRIADDYKRVFDAFESRPVLKSQLERKLDYADKLIDLETTVKTYNDIFDNIDFRESYSETVKKYHDDIVANINDYITKLDSIYHEDIEKLTPETSVNWQIERKTLKKEMELLLAARDEIVKAVEENTFAYNDKQSENFMKKAGKLTVDLRFSTDKAKEAFNEFMDTAEKIIEAKDEYLKTISTEQYEKNKLVKELSNHFAEIIESLKSIAEKYWTIYFNELESWAIEEVAIVQDVSYYQEALDALYDKGEEDRAKRVAVKTINEVDKIIFYHYLPNRSFLLAPLPNDLLRCTCDDGIGRSYSLLTNSDRFVSIIEPGVNKFDDLMTWNKMPQFGSGGILNNTLSIDIMPWSFGSLNTATLVETHIQQKMNSLVVTDYEFITADVCDNKAEVDFIDDYYKSKEPYICKYEPLVDSYAKENSLIISEYSYYDINPKVVKLVENSDDSHKFAYGDPNFLEVLLPDNKKNNIQGEVIAYNVVEIDTYTTAGSNKVTFEDQTSIDRLEYISTGNQVIGKTIPDDVFVDYIDNTNHTITLSKPLEVTGEYVLKYLCTTQFFPKDSSKDFFKYRKFLSESKNTEQGSFFEHNEYDSEFNVSEFIFSPYLDLADYKESLLTALQENDSFRTKFNVMTSWLYKKEDDAVALPSVMNSEGNLFMEVAAHQKYADGKIMDQKVLDYFEEYKDDLTRSSDAINIGVAVNGFTKNDLRSTVDSTISSQFKITKDYYASQPYYIKIGTGFLDEVFAEQKAEEKNTKTRLASYYGVAIYGDDYYSTSIEDDTEVDSKSLYDIAEPLFKSQLGEYEVENNKVIKQFPTKTFTIVQTAIIKRSIEGLLNKATGKILNKTLNSWQSLKVWPVKTAMSNFGEIFIADIQQINYLGDWVPTLEDNKVKMPQKLKSKGFYYSISESNEGFRAGDILYFDGSDWVVKTFRNAGFYGDSINLENLFESKKINNRVATFSLNFYAKINSSMSLLDCLLYKVLNYAGINAKIKDKDNFIKLYKNNIGRKFSENDCWYFTYIGTQDEKLNETFTGFEIVPGSVIGLLYNGDGFDVVLCQESLGLFNFDNSCYLLNSDGSPLNEFLSVTGQTCKSIGDPILISEKLEKFANKIIFSNFTSLMQGSVNTTIKIKLPFVSKGYLYNEDGSIDKSVEFDVSLIDANMFLDKDNLTVYTFNNSTKFALKMENNKYFKNIINNIVCYDEEYTLKTTGLETTGYFKSVEGFNFDSDKMTLFDRILSLDKVYIRSAYDKSLESTFFSKYMTIEGILRGLVISSENIVEKNNEKWLVFDKDSEPKLSISYKYDKDPLVFTNKMNFKNNQSKILPIYYNDLDEKVVYPGDVLEFGKTEYGEQTIISPKVQKVTPYFLSVDDTNSVTYFKNLLLLEGTMDLSNKSTINFTKDKSLTALDKIKSNDYIVDLAVLDDTSTFEYKHISVYNDNVKEEILYADYHLDTVILVTKSLVLFINCPTLSSLENEYEIVTGACENESVIVYEHGDKGDVEGLLYEDEYDHYIVAYKKQSYHLCYYLDKQLGFGDTVYDVDGDDFDVNIYKLVDMPLSEDEITYENLAIKNFSDKYVNGDCELRPLLRDLSIIKKGSDRFNALEHFDKFENLASSPIPFSGVVQGGQESVVLSISNEGQCDIKKDCLAADISLKATGSDISELTLSFSSDPEDGISEIWTYDHNFGRWIYNSSQYKNVLNSIVISPNQEIKVKYYNVSKKFALENTGNQEMYAQYADEDFGSTLAKGPTHGGVTDFTDAPDGRQGEFLWKIPRPEDNDVMFVAVRDDTSINDMKLSLKVKKGSVAYNITNNLILSSNDIDTLIGGDYHLGFFQPNKDHHYKPLMARNNKGISAVLIGKDLFVKSPLRCWGKESEESTVYMSYGFTDENFWTHAHLPRFKDLSYRLFENYTLEEAYNIVATLRQAVIEKLIKYRGSISSGREYVDALFNWLTVKPSVDKDEDGNPPGNQLLDYSNGYIPDTIRLFGVRFESDANGQHPVFDSSNSSAWATKYSVYDSTQEFLGDDSDSYLRQQMYLNYLRDYYEVILGGNRIVDFFEEEAKSIYVTDSEIIIITQDEDVLTLPIDCASSRDEIENFTNWKVKSLCSALEYSTTSESTNSMYIGLNGSESSVSLVSIPLTSKTEKAYTINATYFKGSSQIFAGYYRNTEGLTSYIETVKHSIDTMTVSNEDGEEVEMSTEEKMSYLDTIDKMLIKNFSNKSIAKIPFIAYSNDGGASFTIGDMTNFYQTKTTDDAVTNILKFGTKIFLMLNSYNDTDTNLGNRQAFYFAINPEANDALTLQESIATIKNVFSDNASFAQMFETKTGVATDFIQSSYAALYGDEFFIEVPASINFSKALITNVSSSSLSYQLDEEQANASSSDVVRVLIAVETSSLINNPVEYLDYSDDYLSSSLKLLVKTYVETTVRSESNRAYSYNEIEVTGLDQDYILGLKADVNHTFYDYSVASVGGSEVYTPNPMYNKDGQTIYLCDSEGRLLTKQNCGFDNLYKNVYSIEDLLENNTSIDSFLPMTEFGELKFNKVDASLSKMLEMPNEKIYNYMTLDSLYNGNEDPKLLMKSMYQEKFFNDIIAEAVEHRDNQHLLLYHDCWSGELTEEEHENPFETFVGQLIAKENVTSASIFSERFDVLHYDTGLLDAKSNPIILDLVYERDTNTILFDERKVELLLSMPYEVQQDFIKYSFKDFNISSEDNSYRFNSFNDINIINSVYLDPHGYSGLIDLDKWDDKLPQEVDSEAWKFPYQLMTNEYDENIFLSDAEGNNLQIRKGLFYCSCLNTYTVSYDNLYGPEVEAIIKSENYEDSEMLTFNFYKIEPASIEMYSPQNTVDLVGDGAKLLVKFYKAGVEIEANERFEMTVSAELFKDKSHNERSLAKLEFEDKNIVLSESDADVLYALNNEVTLTVHDNVTGSDTDFVFEAVTEKDTLKIESVDDLIICGLKNKASLKIKTSGSWPLTVVSSDNNMFATIDERTIAVDIIGDLQSRNLKIVCEDSHEYNIQVNIQEVEPKLYMSRDWTDLRFNDPRWRVYSGDIDISDRFEKDGDQIFCKDLDSGIAFDISLDSLEIKNPDLLPEVMNSEGLLDLWEDNFIFTAECEPITYSCPKEKHSFLLEGLFGEVMLLAPEYLNFDNIISKLGRVIETNERVYEYGINKENSFTDLTFDKMALSYTFDDLKNAYFKVKILPVNTKTLSSTVLNSKDCFTEIDIKDIALYGYDRVWVNESINLPAPVEFENLWYNSENMSQYSIDKWKNTNGFAVYLCAEDGRFVKGVKAGKELAYKVIGDSYGNCLATNDIYQNYDSRLNICQALYETSYDLYEAQFGDNSNPFIKYATIGDHIKNSVVQQKVNCYIKQLVNGKQSFVKDPDDLFSVSQSNIFNYDDVSNIELMKNAYFDYTNGTCSFYLYGPDSDFKYKESLYCAGIKYNNPFNQLNTNYWLYNNTEVELESTTDFIVNSTESLTDKTKPSTVQITEVGIFSKDDKLLAYMAHAPVEYDTKKNHISYNLIVEN